MHDLSITAPNNTWKGNLNVYSRASTSSVGLISGTKENGGSGSASIIENMSIQNVNMYNINANTCSTAVIGNVFGNISNISVHNVNIYNKNNSSAVITGQTCGLIGTISGGATINGLDVSGSSLANESQGFSMHDLKLNTHYWGLIGYNYGIVDGKLNAETGTVDSDSNLNDILLSNIDSSNATVLETEYNGSQNYAYGVVGRNSGNNTTELPGTIKNTSMKNIVIEKITLPNSRNYGTYVGVIGENINGKFNNSSSLTHSIDSISISKIYQSDANDKLQETTDYAFIGLNKSYSSDVVILKNLAITNYTSGGFGFVYQNVNGGVENITIGAKINDPAVIIAKQAFVNSNTNEGIIRNSTLNAADSKKFYETNSASIQKCTLNGTPVSN
jgi:hypothetical protein